MMRVVRSTPFAVLLTLLALGCYKPNIQSGGLLCADGGLCPDNFHCASNGRCYEGDAGPDVPGKPVCTSVTPDAATCSKPLAGSPCNPSCQSGCSCGWCAVGNGAVTCLTNTMPGTKQVGDVCNPASTADCAPGLYCLEECGAGRCYKYCDPTNNNADCASLGTACGVNAVNGTYRFTLCRLPARTCDPVSGSGCPAPFACYPFSKTTECDCPGSGTTGKPCASVDACAPGYTCITLGATNQSLCEKTCKVGSDCPLGTTCSNPAMLQYGYCGAL